MNEIRAHYLPIAAPVLCALHCLAAPLLLAIAPAFARSAALEGGLMATALLVAVPTLARGVKVHGRYALWGLAAVGVALWAVELGGLAPSLPKASLTVGGSALLAGALMMNVRLRRRMAAGCDCPVHAASGG